jgi:hypothetical protein
MNQTDKAKAFANLHRKGDPVVLYNIWDAGTAKAVAASGAKALATGSWSVADANGYGDGQQIPMLQLVDIARSIVAATELPVSIDFEGGYAEDPDATAQNVGHVIDTGVVGINFEDQVVGGVILALVAGIQHAHVRERKTLFTRRTSRGWIPVTGTGMTEVGRAMQVSTFGIMSRRRMTCRRCRFRFSHRIRPARRRVP